MAEPSATSEDLGPGPAQAAAELCGWLEAGARAAALLAPAGPDRRRVFEAAASALAGRFAVTRLAAKEGEAGESVVVRADAAARRSAGGAALLVVEDGEVLSPAEARALRGLADHSPGDLRLAVGLAPAASAAELLRALGPGLERVTLGTRSTARVQAPPFPGSRARAALLTLAAGSIAATLALLVPRFQSPPGTAPPTPPAVSAPPQQANASSDAAGAAPVASSADDPRAGEPPEPARVPTAGAQPLPSATSALAPEPTSASAAASATAPVDPGSVAAEGADLSPPARVLASPPPAPAAPAASAPAAPEPPAAGTAAPPASAPVARAPARPSGGYLFVNAIPRARITVSGAAAGTTPIVRFPLARGPHRVVAEFEDGRSEERRIDAVGAETYVVFGGTPR